VRFPPLFLYAASAVVNTVVHAGPAYHFAPVTQQIDDLLSSHPGISGASLIVIREGAPIYEDYFGDYTQTTRIPIASASKWLSAIAIERLVDRGQMRWSDTVGEYFPGASADKQAITLGQLFSHTSGLPASDAPCVGDPSYSLDTCAQQILGLALAYAPGSAFAYTGNGMQVGGRMAEIATGKSWAQIFADEVTTPLGMPDTSFYHPGANPQIAGGIGATMLDYSHAVQMIAQHGTWNGAQYLEADGIVEMQKGPDARRTGPQLARSDGLRLRLRRMAQPRRRPGQRGAGVEHRQVCDLAVGRQPDRRGRGVPRLHDRRAAARPVVCAVGQCARGGARSDLRRWV